MRPLRTHMRYYLEFSLCLMLGGGELVTGRVIMMDSRLADRNQAEVERSASEASKVVLKPMERDQIDRYLNPPADTPYGLEYAFHLLGDVRGKTVLDLGCGTGENTF